MALIVAISTHAEVELWWVGRTNECTRRDYATRFHRANGNIALKVGLVRIHLGPAFAQDKMLVRHD